MEPRNPAKEQDGHLQERRAEGTLEKGPGKRQATKRTERGKGCGEQRAKRKRKLYIGKC